MRPGLRWWLRAGAGCLVLTASAAYADARAQIAVVFSRDMAPYHEALTGFEKVLDSSGKPYRLQNFYLDSPGLSHEKIIERLRAKRPDLILTIGSTATSLITHSVSDIPIVFSLVLPSKGTASLRQNGSGLPYQNVTGASMEIPIRIQFDKVREVLPGARRIGVIYDPDVTGDLVKMASKTATDLGMELVPLSVDSESELISGVGEMLQDVDVLWSVADSTVFSPQGLRQILLTTLRNRVPFVGLSPSFVKAGALLAFSVDYEDVGMQSAELAIRVLNGEKPSRIPVTVPRAVSLSVNMNTAKQIEVPIGEEIRQRAQIFF